MRRSTPRRRPPRRVRPLRSATAAEALLSPVRSGSARASRVRLPGCPAAPTAGRFGSEAWVFRAARSGPADAAGPRAGAAPPSAPSAVLSATSDAAHRRTPIDDAGCAAVRTCCSAAAVGRAEGVREHFPGQAQAVAVAADGTPRRGRRRRAGSADPNIVGSVADGDRAVQRSGSAGSSPGPGQKAELSPPGLRGRRSPGSTCACLQGPAGLRPRQDSAPDVRALVPALREVPEHAGRAAT